MPAKNEQYAVLVRPLMTEKSNHMMAAGVYTFEVAPEANKPQIAQAVRDIFNVKVARVRTVTVKGSKNRRNRFGYFDEKDWKKAMITLEKGQTIDLT